MKNSDLYSLWATGNTPTLTITSKFSTLL